MTETNVTDREGAEGPAYLAMTLVTTPEFTGFINEVCTKLQLDFAAILKEQRTLSGLCRIVSSALRAAQLMTERIPTLPSVKTFYERKLPFACTAGCSYCCRQAIVGVSPIDAIYTAVFARTRLPPAVFEGIRQRTLSQRRPCPMLVDDRCGIYEARPLVCREYFSYDLTLCLAHTLNQVPDQHPVEQSYHQMVQHVHSAVEQVVAQVMAANQLSYNVLEFDRALRILFTQPDAIERWLTGEDVFASATWSRSTGQWSDL